MFYNGKNHYKGLGMMSGTSLDGVDLAACDFNFENDNWNFEILQAETIPYPSFWVDRLNRVMEASAAELASLNMDLGKYYGKIAFEFLNHHKLEVDYIASHGHTVFHDAEKGFTFQAGNGVAIAAATHQPVIYDFRTADIVRGGQGAPLVPIGDELLFNSYSACINLGGFANISYNKDGKRIAFDLCPANMALNFLAQKANLPFDYNGELAASGRIIQPLLFELLHLEYFSKNPPKSLGKEWFLQSFLPILNKYEGEQIQDLSRTVCELIAIVIMRSLFDVQPKEKGVLITGGGAHHHFLLQRIKELSTLPIAIPSPCIIDFKEALVFAFLGLLFLEQKPNILSSATGAETDSIGGCLYLP
ncbi:MAG: anhydro-N-acetylmuramic acid kinase [Bacteroidales bacterium]|jgi:anhydro-N-acetylmuramic acid kinase|nr:anhydro-N-acetylmuramic acid kinase [Bacteroidales bacterium]MDI9573804.1 anhydro-N-acetylmuramic acid kinase [Bacteroidota bacterium]MBP9588046.1 anhydro-N-acetylmuramic acid kinase [Bacteroidales bacterium]NMD15795.1 anhydro-N-acetylmuramic acid kinase [Bacteroidales bacterium]HOE58492.1 anhydro-N-acetylmuramic acid kinase [Bacteroidales bacterium]